MKKRVLSTVAAGAFAATQLVMPVAAATGTVTVPVETQTTVLRVEVPTTLKVAVNEFESGDAGSQIYSAPFTMLNKSAVPVKVAVTSTVTLKASGVQLVASADAIENDGDVWLAVAAQTAAGSYGADLAALTNESSNVTAFDTTGKNAAQTFYLAQGTGNVVNKLLVADAKDQVAAFGDVFEVSEVGTGSGDPLGSADATTVVLDAVTGAAAVYSVATGDKGKDDIVLTAVAEGDKYDSSKTYYMVADSAAAATTLIPSKMYVYSEQATAGGAAAFRYIGKLSEEKTGSWSKNDITTIGITYDIQGVGSTVYDGKKVDCVYGLYTAPAAPSVTSASVKAVAGKDAEFTVDLGAGTKGASGIDSVVWDGNDFLAGGDIVFEDGKLTLAAETVDWFIAENALPVTMELTFTMNDADAEPVVVELQLTK